MTDENREKVLWLSRYRKLGKRVDQKCEELSQWRSRSEKVTSSFSDGPKGGEEGNRLEETVERIIAIEEELNREIDEMVDIRKEIQAAISSLEDCTLEALMEMRYLGGRSWEEIAVALSYNYRWILRLHKKAIGKLATLGHINL
ncbi:DUF1492 domain-containing protein [Acetanaerobacterium sp. MSJ-12]|uniref:DUF1492 domain-containing protein n=1 Tax=Acetanaerobacterium sp. MSJ-12 TaxID=2841535 RepID=UPI001C0EC6F9|nr:DUF1492 domain-containing protein [Acetanaerobacterium sp. MSJ-12]MBU5419982.1 DUF1492 domain-containing protein [Acetanaerobacterium sp. MSJ-12]